MPLLASQQAQKPLTNDDVITMVKSGMPESVVVSAIQSRPGKFSTSTSELVRLHKAGVTENEFNAMIAGSSKGRLSQRSALRSRTKLPLRSQDTGECPRRLTAGGSAQELPLEKTQLAETKTKPSSIKACLGFSGNTSDASWNQPASHTAAVISAPASAVHLYNKQAVFFPASCRTDNPK